MATAGTTLLYVAFGLVVGIAVYYAFRYVTGAAGRAPLQTTYLKTQSTAIPIGDFSDPLSVRCTYSFWVFINNLDPAVAPAKGSAAATTVFTLKDPAGSATAAAIAALQLNASSALTFTKGSGTGSSVYALMDNFPMQKWTRLDLSFDNLTFDFYLDGKLLRSYQMTGMLVTPANTVVQFGSIDAYLNGFARTAQPIDPATAQANYLSGQKTLSGSALPKYGVSVQLVKDAVVQKSFSLF